MDTGTGTAERRIALELQYDGTCFNGMQIQNGGRTVQDELEKALRVLLKEKIRITASGRTDSGVHALGQVVHFDTNRTLALQRICIGMNGILSRDCAVKNAYLTGREFHARFSAIERKYRYLIHNHPLRTPFMMHRTMWVQELLDVVYMRDVFNRLIGEKDFSSFCKKKGTSGINTVRKINAIDVVRHNDIIQIDISGNGFLHNMVRIMVGTVVQMNQKNHDPGIISEIIEKRDRDSSGITAPACGLYLMKVSYSPQLAEMESAFNEH